MDNDKFLENFAKLKQIENKYTLETSSLEFPLNRIIWARLNYQDPTQDIEPLPASKNGYGLSYVHGHDSLGAVRSDHIGRVTNLDHEIGKRGVDYIGHYGKYIVHVSTRGFENE